MTNENRGLIVIAVAGLLGIGGGYVIAHEMYRQECAHSHIQMIQGNMYRCFRVETVKQSER